MSDHQSTAILRQALTRIAEAECWTLGGPWFMGRPERWWEDPTWRCQNEHVSKRYLGSEERGGLCLACQEPVFLSFPEDVDGPLVAPRDSGRTEADRG